MNLSQPAQRSRLRSIGLPTLIFAGTLVLISFLMATRPRLEVIEAPERTWYVDVAIAEHGRIQPHLKLFGEVVAGRRSELRPAVSGIMVEIGENFREGSYVRKGELLVQIDPFDYRTDLAEQKSMLKESKVKLEMMRRDLERAKELYAAKNVSEQFLDGAELDVAQQEAIVEQREIGVRRAERDLQETRLVAPFDGVVHNVNAALGKNFSGFGADMVGEVIDTGQIEVRFSLSNAQYGRLVDGGESIIGLPARVNWTVGDSVFEYDAEIKRVGAEIASTTGGVEAYAVIVPGAGQTLLRPGAFVSVNVPDRPFDNALRAPDTALYGEDLVYVIEDDRLAARRIEILGYAGNDVLFRSVGAPAIRDGDRIVTTQLREAGPGAKVAVKL
ncbi:MAG: efflux RND transporter periplasmic adaptor subunit [Gammaproteobacteria bacterium]|nr:efflux RND transporter periplasmic adaptor subunit [Gammaproteobacteria bacterium]NND36428.1 efflux RND transporter periplasmic adaptor subunit [Gammaproteobacteria bacterium]